jgi:hypothetical protein
VAGTTPPRRIYGCRGCEGAEVVVETFCKVAGLGGEQAGTAKAGQDERDKRDDRVIDVM